MPDGGTQGVVRALRDEYDATLTPLREKRAEADRLERRISDLVNAAYGLTLLS